MPGKESVTFLNWEGDAAVFVSNDKMLAGFWLAPSAKGEWEEMSAGAFISASKNAFIVSEEGFFRTFGKTPPPPSLDARSK